MNFYKYKYVCKKCDAVHYYKPNKGCQKCGSKLVQRFIAKKEKKKVNDNSEELDLEVDRLRLDDEWVKHPKQYYVWAKKSADAQYVYDQAKAELELTKAELDQEIRNNPGTYGLPEKVTELKVANTIILQNEYQVALKYLNTKRHELDIAHAAVNTLEQRKRQLTVLVELWIRDYYSEATIHGKTNEGKEFEKKTVRSRGRKRREREKEDEQETMLGN